MISWRSLRNFLLVNTVLLSISFGFLHSPPENIYPAYLLKNLVLVLFIDSRHSLWTMQNTMYFMQTSLIECYLMPPCLHSVSGSQFVKEAFAYLILSFGYEVVFDLFHYVGHRVLHTNRTCFRWIHAHHHHHSHSEMNVLTTFVQHPLDVVLTNSIPCLLVMSLFNFSATDMAIFQVYKTFTEVSGHVNRELKGTCFPQNMWLPRGLGIELSAEDHLMHHKIYSVNFSKRFTLWDKVFETFVAGRIKSVENSI